MVAEASRGAGSYDFPVDLQNLNSVPAQLARHIPPGSRVLDVGCASGNLSGLLIRERGCSVVGVEKDPEAAAAATAKGLDTRVLDLDAEPLTDKLGEARFDRVILADVLEHLTAPERVLAEASALLRPRGAILVSIPNISHIDVVLALVHDRWDYRDSGLLDRTHIHFFTESSFRKLADSVPLAVREMTRLTLPPLHTELWPAGEPRPDADHVAQLRHATGRFNPNCEVYQFVFRLTPLSPTRRVLRRAFHRPAP